MTKITLRGYIQEIEKIIEQGQTEEAIAHCRQILNTYPKHINTYRLMGKAYLESRRYGDASDIFQRVLSAIPDDFVSHVGMSIIREDEGNLDASIWHMERAFEVQPYNAAIQNELRRLYGRRDGMEPPKVRLTQGALARMYAKGNLFQQAIAELKSTIADDPRRSDLQIVLARMYAESGQNAEAVETCSNLLQQLPNCLLANRILSEILPGTGRLDEAAKYQKRIEALDPYEAHVSPNAPTASDVPDQAVTLERLEWEPGILTTEVSAQPDWAASLGVELDEETEEEMLPDWLTTSPDEMSEEELTQISESEPSGEELFFPDSEEEEIAIRETKEEPPPEFEAVDIEDDETPDWLQDIIPTEDVVDEEESKRIVSAEESIESGELPEWLQELEEEPSPEQIDEITEEDIPDWLAGLEEEDVAEEVESEEPITRQSDIELIEEEIESMEISEIADEIEPETTEEFPVETSIPDEGSEWLEDLDVSALERDEELEGEFEIESADMPQWLRDIAEETPTAMEEGVAPEKVLDDSDIEKADVPELLQEMGDKEHVTEGVQEPSPTDDDEEGLPFSIDDEDAALAWLESLAAKQGVHEEELITKPEERAEISFEEKTEPETVSGEEVETAEEDLFAPSLEHDQTRETEPEIPTWLKDFMEEAPHETEEVKAEEIESLEEITSEMPIEAEIPEWLADLDEEVSEVPEAEPEISDPEEHILADIPTEAEPQPEQVDLDEEPPVVEAEPDISTTEPALSIDDELPEWLIELADETPEKPADVETKEPEIDEQIEVPAEEVVEELEFEVSTDEAASEEIPEWVIETEEKPEIAPIEEEEPADEIEAVIEEGALYPISERDEFEPIEIAEVEPPQEDDLEPEMPKVEAEAVEIPDDLESVTVEPAIDEERDWILEEVEEPELEPEEIQAAREEIEVHDLINLNTASEESLETLSGIGPHLAKSIVAHRETHGPFDQLEDLLNVAGIGPTHLEGFEGFVTVEFVEAKIPDRPLEDEYQTIHARAIDNLSQGYVDKAIEDYDHLLKLDYRLEQIIQELSEATYQHPLDIGLLQSLGDAYMRSDRLQEALETYNRAEELLR